MDLPELIILDVGHGNCTLLRDRDETIVIDCGSRATLIETLRALDIQEIAHVLISHADADHIGGLINLLSEEDVRINSIHMNYAVPLR